MSKSRNGWCVHCRSRLDLLVEEGGSIVACPHCGREMQASEAIAYRKRFRQTRRRIWIGVGALVVIGLASLAYFNRALLRWGYDLLVEETGSHTAALGALAAGCVALLWLALWILFPVVVFAGFLQLRRRTVELEETTRLCARHLAQLTARAERRDGPGLSRRTPLSQMEASLTPTPPVNRGMNDAPSTGDLKTETPA